VEEFDYIDSTKSVAPKLIKLGRIYPDFKLAEKIGLKS